jgi:hypothetical protein
MDMTLVRHAGKTAYTYSLAEVARFLQYDDEAVRYWLRMGHLQGCVDSQTGEWRVSASDLVSFLRRCRPASSRLLPVSSSPTWNRRSSDRSVRYVA